MEFNEKEVKDFVLTVAALSVIASLKELLSGSFWFISLLVSMVIITLSLFAKLVVQKSVAKRYDCSATYKFDYNLFIISLLISFITNGGIIFAATGSILVSSIPFSRLGHKFINITQREEGTIKLSGPMANVVLALISLVLYPISPALFQKALNINVFFALFNMIPIPPLDGEKVLLWNRLIWVTSSIIPLFLFFFGFNAVFSLAGILLLIIIIFVLWQKMF